MKKLHKVLIVVAVAVVAAITGVMVTIGTAGEPAQSRSNVMSTEQIMAIYPGFLDYMNESQPQTVEFTTEQVMAIYPGFLDYINESQSQTTEESLKQLPWVPGIYFHP